MARSLQVYLDLRREGLALHNHDFPNEAGLLGFAFHPDFAERGKRGHGKFYTAYSAAPETLAEVISGSNQESVIREWTIADPGATAFVGTAREVFRVSQFAPTHNIGTIAFNPAAAPGSDDYGLLYVCLGDGGGANDPQKNGQNPDTLLSAILRIDPLGRCQGRVRHSRGQSVRGRRGRGAGGVGLGACAMRSSSRGTPTGECSSTTSAKIRWKR